MEATYLPIRNAMEMQRTQNPVTDIWLPDGGGDAPIPSERNIPLQVERRAVVPVQQGVIAYGKHDDGGMRNRVDAEHYPYEDRMYALTLVHNGPQYTGVTQHIMQENSEWFSVRTGQTLPLVVDPSATLPYIEPATYELGSMALHDSGPSEYGPA